jgi:hypothetical protein
MFGEWAPTVLAFLHLPTLYIVHFLLLTPPVYSKNDGGVEMMTKVMKQGILDRSRSRSRSREREREQVSGLFCLSRHKGFCELAAQQFERLDKQFLLVLSVCATCFYLFKSQGAATLWMIVTESRLVLAPI